MLEQVFFAIIFNSKMIFRFLRENLGVKHTADRSCTEVGALPEVQENLLHLTESS
jgi:hypothetical protein